MSKLTQKEAEEKGYLRSECGSWFYMDGLLMTQMFVPVLNKKDSTTVETLKHTREMIVEMTVTGELSQESSKSLLSNIDITIAHIRS